MHDRIFLVAAVSDHGYKVSHNRGARRIRRIRPIVKVPAGEAIESYEHSVHCDRAANRTRNSGCVEPMNIDVLQRYVGSLVIQLKPVLRIVV